MFNAIMEEKMRIVISHVKVGRRQMLIVFSYQYSRVAQPTGTMLIMESFLGVINTTWGIFYFFLLQ